MVGIIIGTVILGLLGLCLGIALIMASEEKDQLKAENKKLEKRVVYWQRRHASIYNRYKMLNPVGRKK